MRKKAFFIKDEKTSKQKSTEAPKTETMSTTELKRNLDLILTYGQTLPQMAEVERKGDRTVIKYQMTLTPPYAKRKEKVDVYYSFPSLETIQRDNDTVKKILNHILAKMIEQVPLNADGTPKVNSFSFSTYELVNLCGFKDIDTANKALDKLKSILDNFNISFGNSAIKNSYSEKINLYHKLSRHQTTVTVTLYKEDKIGALFQYVTQLPLFSYGFKGKVFSLLQHILTMARHPKQLKTIATKGYFTMSIENIIRTLNLPLLEQTKSPTERIQQPILDYLNAIQDAYEENYNGKCISYKILTPTNEALKDAEIIIDDDGNYVEETEKQPVRAWVKNKVKIEFSGVLLNFHKQLYNTTEKNKKYKRVTNEQQ